jgi:hypothetical protein
VRRLLRPRIVALAVIVSLAVLYRENAWFASEVSRTVEYVRDQSDSAATTVADSADQGAATLRCLDCLGDEAESLVDRIVGYGASLSIYKRLERSVTGTEPCNAPGDQPASATTGSQRPEQRASDPDRTCS